LIMKYIVRILEIKPVTHDVKYFRLEKPEGFQFVPGQATDLSINKPRMDAETRPFTFTSLNTDRYLEFTIKRYPDHHGVTDQLHQLIPGDELIISDGWGAISYNGPGYFIAGGAGITPFISILRFLSKQHQTGDNRLFFSNKTVADIIYADELSKILGNNLVLTLTREQKPGYEYGRVDESFLKKQKVDFSKHFYVCGPDPMVAEVVQTLERMGASADSLVFEK
jgi:glycine betaine catabolism B